MTKMSYPLWMLLKKYYDSSKGCILLDNNLSECFLISCGVKQGGIISSFLFNVYNYDLLAECISLNIGAIISNINMRIISYADDIILLSQSDAQLQTLLDTWFSRN